jgi:hypothetical protein
MRLPRPRWAVLTPTILLATSLNAGLAGASEMDEEEMESVGESIASMLGFYLVHKEQRDPLEQVVVDGNAAEIWFLHTMAGDEKVRARCDAYQWLFFGRLKRSKGIKQVFKRFGFLEEVKMILFDVKTRIEPDGKRGYRQFRKTSPRMEVTLTRETATALNFGVLRSRMEGSRCVREAEKIVDRKWYRE